MIDRVLIAEDYESAGISIQKALEDLKIDDAQFVNYCDDALRKLITSNKLGKPYDLLITDLSFEEDGRPQQITNGSDLITAVRSQQPGIKVLVFSVESRAAVLENLFNKLQIDGYVRKARNDVKELRQAIITLSQNRRHLPRNLNQLINEKNIFQFSETDIAIITLLASGVNQKNIPGFLEKKQLSPSSLSSIEKRLKLIKSELNFVKNEQIVAYCKDMGLI